MTTTQPRTTVKNLDTPDDVRRTDHGRMDVVTLDGATIVRATYRPGWRWSTDVRPAAGTASCQVAHTGVVLSGRFRVRTDDGAECELGPGDAHTVAPGHDAWVVGNEPVTVLDVSTARHGVAVDCPCGVEFRVAAAGDGQLEHLIAAVQQHAAAIHGHATSRDELLAAVTRS